MERQKYRSKQQREAKERRKKGEEMKSIEGEENRREYYIFLYVLTW